MDATQTQTQSRKRRSRPSNSPDNSGDDSKKRGRPRVEKQDESAADRRRTQIRMAQRAYRQRKESTLEELRKRVSDLTNTIELMNKAFMDCRDRLAAAGLPESQMQDMRETSMQYDKLMKIARNPGEEPDPDFTRSIHRPSATSTNDSETRPVVTEPKNVPSWMDESVINQPPKQRDPMQVGLGYTMYMQESDDMSSPMEYFGNMDQHQALVPVTAHKQPHPNSLDAFRVEVADSLSIPAAMSPPRTYSFQESTFARRLHRACIESAYQLLLDPTRRPATYDRVFKLSLMSRDRAKLTSTMKSMLSKGPHEALDHETALIHVGGAGTHYSRRDQYGNLGPKKESWNLGIVGPQTLALLENAARDNLTTDMTVDIAGFEGEWFDPYDVEGYLNEKGIYIDPTSSFAEAEVLIWSGTGNGSASSSLTLSTAPSPKTPGGIFSTSDPPRPFDPEQLAVLGRETSNAGEWNDFGTMSFTDIGFSDAGTGSWTNFLQPGEAIKSHVPIDPAMEDTAIQDTTWEGSRGQDFLAGLSSTRAAMFQQPKDANVSSQQKKLIIIDVAKFVKVMTVSGVCLSRTPGFKRRDVDRALALSSFDAF